MQKEIKHFFDVREKKYRTRKPELGKLSRALLVNLFFYEVDERNRQLYGWKRMEHVKKTNKSFFGTPFYYTSEYTNVYTNFEELMNLGLVVMTDLQFMDKRKHTRTKKHFRLAIPDKLLYPIILSIIDDYMIESEVGIQWITEKIRNSTHVQRFEPIISLAEKEFLKAYKERMVPEWKEEYARTLDKLTLLEENLKSVGVKLSKTEGRKIMNEMLNKEYNKIEEKN